MGDEPQAMCACNRVERKTRDHGDGTVSDYWVCVTPDGCGQEFVHRTLAGSCAYLHFADGDDVRTRVLALLPDASSEQVEGILEYVVNGWRAGYLGGREAEREPNLRIDSPVHPARSIQFMQNVLVEVLAGVVPTPEQGYAKDGGFGLLLSDLKRLRGLVPKDAR